MSNEEILNELLIKVHEDGIFKEFIDEINKIDQSTINSNNRLEIFEKAIENVRRNKTI
jgi:hypothetical protein